MDVMKDNLNKSKVSFNDYQKVNYGDEEEVPEEVSLAVAVEQPIIVEVP